MRFARRRYLQETVELNITAFLNLMVILVPFLLITAVFSRMTVLELNLPGLDADNQESQEPVDLSLQLIVREDSFDLADASLGLIRSIERTGGEDNWQLFGEVLLEIKRRFPEEQSITLLLEPGTSYKTMIAVMDHVRSTQVVEVASLESVELFPNISIGDAPPQSGAATQAGASQ
ncbi:ExbD/TolR family protein [Gilvimarinus sp. F26214L]|uniref:ExbD/TolR family protein n=1 Tax=Gilvimarinus sp. DZF01 TaxID=3461371 RepID=UPI00404583F7